MTITTISVDSNTFEGPNEGAETGYVPHTEIESAKVDSDFLAVKADLDYHLALFQLICAKLNTIDVAQIGYLDATMIINAMNTSTLKLPLADLDPAVASEAEVAALIEAHRTTTVSTSMHPETAIRSTELTYSNTPSSVITICNNLLDELKNIRFQIHRLNGKTNWIDSPDSSIAGLKASTDSILSQLNVHKNDTTVHVTANQHAALDAAHSPTSGNPFVTMSDIATKGPGDMLKSVYDANNDGIVDKSAGIMHGSSVKTYQNILDAITTAIQQYNADHPDTADYTDAMAIQAINNDVDHSSTAKHYYADLLGKPAASPADAMTQTEVTNIRGNKLANGTTPWTGYVSLNSSGYVRANVLPNIMVMPTSWSESVLDDKYYDNEEGTVSATINGPAVIYGGIGVYTPNNGFLKISVNGSTWVDVHTTPSLWRGPGDYADNLNVWFCPPMYVPAGRKFMIKAGNCNCTSGSKVYGGGYNINYKSLNAE